MKRMHAILFISICFALSANAQMPDSATIMKNWMNYMTPGAEHKLMASWNGTWTGDVSMWMVPGAPVMKSKGTNVNTMLMGGRYQQSKFTTTINGMPFEGLSTMGFDNIKKVFIATWVDNMGTGVSTSEGVWDPASKSVTLRGKTVDPTTGKEVMIREVLTSPDANTQTMEMYAQGPDGKEFKTMEIKYKKQM